MRARIEERPDYMYAWVVSTRAWWWPVWIHRKSFFGDDAYAEALACAKRYHNPRILEVTK